MNRKRRLFHTRRCSIWPGALVFLLTACARTTGPAAERPISGGVQLTGQIAVTGTGGAIITSLQVDGRSVTLLGGLSSELRNLSGARVLVEGSPAAGGAGESINVVRYQIVEVNGQKPYVGTLVRTGDHHAIDTGERTIRLERLPAGLIDRAGARVWVTGVISGGRLQVQAYGVIRAR